MCYKKRWLELDPRKKRDKCVDEKRLKCVDDKKIKCVDVITSTLGSNIIIHFTFI